MLLSAGLIPDHPAAANLAGRAVDGIASVSARVRAARVRLTTLTRLVAYRPPAMPPQIRDRIGRALAAGAADRADTGRPHTSHPQMRVLLAAGAHGLSKPSADDRWQGWNLRVPAPRDPGVGS